MQPVNPVIEMANRAMEYRDKVTELYNREAGENEVAPEYKAINNLCQQFEAGSSLLELMVDANLTELAQEVFGDLVTQNFVLDLQFYLLSIYSEAEITEVIRRLAFALAAGSIVVRNDVPQRDPTLPTDNIAYTLTRQEIEDILMSTPWLMGMLLLSLATEGAPNNGTPTPVA